MAQTRSVYQSRSGCELHTLESQGIGSASLASETGQPRTERG